MKRMILVTGATGHLGGSIVKHLLTKISADQIVVLVRDENKAADLKAAGVHIRIGDYHDSASLTDAFVNIEKTVLVSSNDFNDRLGQHKNVINAAKLAGVRHFVYTGVSIKDIHTSVLRDFMIDHFQTEEYVKDSGMKYTFMRHNLYAEMIPFYIGHQVLEKGVVFPAGEGRIPFALRDEMGEANANVLTTEGHEDRIYSIASEVDYSFQDIADILSELSGKRITYTNPDNTRFTESLKAAGLPNHIVQIAIGFSTAMRNGDFDVPGTDLKNLLGRKPAGLKEYLQQTYLGV
ncbi:SDR family oxidoreductase [Xanthocytophaga agilis]|uniref:SDR family oxidoreductase n=1 Tax=Xanthocytophaga agilis TaxID=3048010 RepID=A0AAE3R6L3_9BACT|nr:SDR family oxidoreductase [Xanthocytophaga agilis]MDJ1501743.1 SDR family oxidoreductase [Xanthocytophaga agilis]